MMLDNLLTLISKYPEAVCENAGTLLEFVKKIDGVERFAFGELAFEYREDDGTFTIPELTDDEIQFWYEKLIPIPAPRCWYEFTLNDHHSGLLIDTDSDGSIWVSKIDFFPSALNTRTNANVYGFWFNQQSYEGPFALRCLDKKAFDELYDDKHQLDLEWGVWPMLMYLTLMLNSQTTEVRKVIPSAESNVLRRMRGMSKLKPHTIVTIVPKRFVDHTDGKGGTHASPRLHWRRSHRRTYHKDTPNEYSIAIPRFLVGKRDLGEVTHDYRVKTVEIADEKRKRERLDS